MNSLCEKCNAATSLSTSRLFALLKAYCDPTVASATVSSRNAIVTCLCSKKSRLPWKVSRLPSAVGLFQALHNELEMSRQRLTECGAEIVRLCVLFTSVRDLLDNVCEGPENQS